MNIEIVILSGASRSFIAGGAVEGPAVCSSLRPFHPERVIIPILSAAKNPRISLLRLLVLLLVIPKNRSHAPLKLTTYSAPSEFEPPSIPHSPTTSFTGNLLI